MLASPQSLHLLLMRSCSQMPDPPNALQLLLWRLCGHFARVFFTDAPLALLLPTPAPSCCFWPSALRGRGTLSLLHSLRFACAFDATLLVHGHFLFLAFKLLASRPTPSPPSPCPAWRKRDVSPTFSFVYMAAPGGVSYVGYVLKLSEQALLSRQIATFAIPLAGVDVARLCSAGIGKVWAPLLCLFGICVPWADRITLAHPPDDTSPSSGVREKSGKEPQSRRDQKFHVYIIFFSLSVWTLFGGHPLKLERYRED